MKAKNFKDEELMHELNGSDGHVEAVRTTLFSPQSAYDAWLLTEPHLKHSAQIKSTVRRTVVPAYGGSEPEIGRQASPQSLDLLKTISLVQLHNAIARQEAYFDRANMPSDHRRRHRHYLNCWLSALHERGWLTKAETDGPAFNLLNKTNGKRRIYSEDVKTTGCKRVPAYRLGTSPEHYVVVGDQKVLGNPNLVMQLDQLTQYIDSIRSDSQPIIYRILRILTFLHECREVPLADLSLELLVPYVQLQFSEEDFEGHDAFQKTHSGQLLDPIAAEQTLAMNEAMAQRRASKVADMTTALLYSFFDWRKQKLADLGQIQGLESNTKHCFINALELIAEYLYRGETRFRRSQKRRRYQKNTGFHDIPVIAQLRQMYAEYPLDHAETKERIHKRRCTRWSDALMVVEKQRRKSLVYYLDYRSRQVKKGYTRSRRKLHVIAADLQRTLMLTFMFFIPTDRQQTYRDLQFGKNLKCGYFRDDDETFVEQGRPDNPNQTQFWLDLHEYKTAKTYGQFWYPLPNVTFVDGTTFYELIVGWLWGFEDTKGNWPVCYPQDSLWQGYIDAKGLRQGWRAALKPDKHDFFFTTPTAKHPFTTSDFRHVIRHVFVRFTQETGPAIPVTPHSLRHMLSTYLAKLDLSHAERESFAYVLHHSLETHEKNYV